MTNEQQPPVQSSVLLGRVSSSTTYYDWFDTSGMQLAESSAQFPWQQRGSTSSWSAITSRNWHVVYLLSSSWDETVLVAELLWTELTTSIHCLHRTCILSNHLAVAALSQAYNQYLSPFVGIAMLWLRTTVRRVLSSPWTTALFGFLSLKPSLVIAQPIIMGSSILGTQAMTPDTKETDITSFDQNMGLDSANIDTFPIAWYIFALYALLILVGFGYSLWTVFLNHPRYLWLYLLGALFLVMSVVWTVISCTSTSDWRYLAQAAWAMLAITFVTESFIGVNRLALFSWTIFGFVALVTLIAAGTGKIVDTRDISALITSRHQAMPSLLTLWALIVSFLFHWTARCNRRNQTSIDDGAYEMGGAESTPDEASGVPDGDNGVASESSAGEHDVSMA